MKKERYDMLKELIQHYEGRLGADLESGTLKKKSFPNNQGYLYTALYKGGKGYRYMVHNIIACIAGIDFIDKDINHIDGNKKNNRIENLEALTRSENMKHAFRIGLADSRGEKCSRAKLKENEVKEIRKLFETGNYTKSELARMFEVSRRNVRSILENRTWRNIL